MNQEMEKKLHQNHVPHRLAVQIVRLADGVVIVNFTMTQGGGQIKKQKN